MARVSLQEKPLVFIDCETTGLDPLLNEIIEFAGIKRFHNGQSETLVVKVKPRRIHTAQPKALEVNGYTEAEWEDAEDIATAAPKIIAFLRNAVIVGHNVKFDVAFIEAFLKEAGISERIDYHVVDTCTLAYVMLVPQGAESLSLTPVCKFLGIEPEPAVHRALAGSQSCMKVYDALVAPILMSL